MRLPSSNTTVMQNDVISTKVRESILPHASFSNGAGPSSSYNVTALGTRVQSSPKQQKQGVKPIDSEASNIPIAQSLLNFSKNTAVSKLITQGGIYPDKSGYNALVDKQRELIKLKSPLKRP